jgi:voltage-gated potassium channel
MDERSERIAERFRRPILITALMVVPVLVLDEANLGQPWDTFAAVGNWLVWLAFAVEAVVMLSVVPDRVRWIRDNPFALPVVLLTPPFAPASLQSARAFRLVQLLRLGRSFRLIRRFFSLEGLRFVAVLTLFVVLAGGTAFAAVEKGQHLSPWDGVWWAITTVTAASYGDIQPRTDEGRVIAISILVVGLGFVTMLTAALAQAFIARSVEHQIDEAVDEAVDQVEDEVVRRLDDISARLGRIEARDP